jgi:hypothetical protein
MVAPSIVLGLEKMSVYLGEERVPSQVDVAVGAEPLERRSNALVLVVGRVRQLADLGQKGRGARHKGTVAVEDEAVADA